jgi:hypothetical protein
MHACSPPIILSRGLPKHRPPPLHQPRHETLDSIRFFFQKDAAQDEVEEDVEGMWATHRTRIWYIPTNIVLACSLDVHEKE